MNEGGGDVGFTDAVAARAATVRLEGLPARIVTLAGQCLLDWLAAAIAGSAEPAWRLLATEIHPAPAGTDAAGGGATVVGDDARRRARAADAALLNAAAAHALDFDDVNQVMTGHPSAATLAAVLALAEEAGAPGRAVVEAYVAGYEAQCSVSRAIEPAQYRRGFHTTGTTGALGAAAGAARLLGLGRRGIAGALGLAATQAAGLAVSFGTMAKPLNVGRAAAAGVLAARLAARGFTAGERALEAPGGFAATHGDGLDAEAARRGLARPPSGFHLSGNLFKYHAACYGTHSVIEGIRHLRRDAGLRPAGVERIVIHASERQRAICSVPDPATALEAKFSLRQTAAMAVCGRDTTAPVAYERSLADGEVAAVRSRVDVIVDRTDVDYTTPVEVRLAGGGRLRVAHDVSTPEPDLVAQQAALAEKARRLAGPLVGDDAVERLIAGASAIAEAPDVAGLLRLTQPVVDCQTAWMSGCKTE